MKQFILPSNPNDRECEKLRLSGRDYHYLVHVRRYRKGDTLEARSPQGTLFTMEILQVNRDSCEVSLQPISSSNHEEPSEELMENMPHVTLMPGITKGRKMDLTVRQAVEVGAAALWPVITDYSQVKFPTKEAARNRWQRWNRIAVEALQQCGGSRLTSMEEPQDLQTILEMWNKRGQLFYLHEKRIEDMSFHEHLATPTAELAIMTGPEGGLSKNEVNQLMAYGAHPIYLGSRVLRAETAAVFGLAAVLTINRERKTWRPA